jgi:dimethylargininase
MLVALIRDVSPSLQRCELTHLSRQPIDVVLARRQHRRYERCLADLGCAIHRLPTEPEWPDAVFIEDTAIVLDELAIIARPGAESRRAETTAVAEALRAFRSLFHIEPPGTLDGGDVLRLGQTVYVGVSSRSNEAGFEQLRRWLMPYGYAVEAVEVNGCLHLKSAVTPVGENTLLVNRAWVDAGAFGDAALIDVDPSEPFGGNALLVNETVMYPSGYPRTQRRLQEHGITVQSVDVSELGKAEGGVTCCSLIFSVR